MDQVKKDSRFSHISKDSRFHKMPQKYRKVQIDNRFKSMFSDKRFKTKYQVDKRGRPVQTSSNENLKNYYELSDSSSNDEDEENDNAATDDEEPEPEVMCKIEKVGKERKKDHRNPEKGKFVKVVKEAGEEENGSSSDDDGEEDHKSSSDSCSGTDESEAPPANKSKVSKTKSKSKTLSVKPKDPKPEKSAGKKKTKQSKKKNESSSESEEDDFKATSDAIKQGIDVARGEGMVSSSSEDEEEEDSDDSGVDEDVEELDHRWGELEADAVEAKEISRRLALCNMDWDRIKAQDILVLLNSFKPQGGIVQDVKIYPSEYGLKRMEEDNRLGPVELRSTKQHPEDSSDEEDTEIQQEKLRQYQINRLKYYYAVITCDTAETADAIYGQCDGLEYETSSAKIDLRFIPDDMEFDHEPTSVADKMLDGVSYKPSSFVTSALNQTKVSLTWEETDPDRLKHTMRKFTKDEVDDMDLKDYLASDSDDDDEVRKDDAEVSKFRSLLGDTKAEEKVDDGNMEMEISWEPGLKEAAEKAVKKKTKGGQTPWEKYLEKRALKRREKLDEKMKMKEAQEKGSGSENEDEKEEDDTPEGVDMNDPFFKDAFSDEETYEKKPKKSDKKKKKGKKEKPKESPADPDLDLLVMDEDDQKQHFSLEQIMKNEQKKKKKHKKGNDEEPTVEDTFKLDIADDRFSAMYTKSTYNIDPSAPEYKKTKAMEALVGEKLKRRAKESEGPQKKVRKEAAPETTSADSIQNLVKSVKAKAKMNQHGKKKK